MPIRTRLFLNLWFNTTGSHADSWNRAPEQRELSGPGLGDRARIVDVEHYVRVAELAHRGRFDALFLADQPQLTPDPATRPEYPVDPIVLLSTVLSRVPDIGGIATASTGYSEPYTVARQIASANLLTGGRVGWNAVATFRAEVGANYGRPIDPHGARYVRAEEFLDVVRALWGSWRFPWDRSRDRLPQPYGEVRPIEHTGTHFSVAGPLNVPAAPDGDPVIAQAGGSRGGMELASRHADIVYSNNRSRNGSRGFVRRMRLLAEHAGRPAPLVMPSLSPLLGSDDAEAARLLADYEASLPDLTARVSGLSRTLGVDLTNVDLDEILDPDALVSGEDDGWPVGVKQAIIDVARDEPRSLRELLRATSQVRATTPEKLADELVEWWATDAADGFTITPQLSPAHLEPIIDELIPALRRRGVFPSEYTEAALRARFEESAS